MEAWLELYSIRELWQESSHVRYCPVSSHTWDGVLKDRGFLGDGEEYMRSLSYGQDREDIDFGLAL
jgi:hypothetical protein